MAKCSHSLKSHVVYVVAMLTKNTKNPIYYKMTQKSSKFYRRATKGGPYGLTNDKLKAPVN